MYRAIVDKINKSELKDLIIYRAICPACEQDVITSSENCVVICNACHTQYAIDVLNQF